MTMRDIEDMDGQRSGMKPDALVASKEAGVEQLRHTIATLKNALVDSSTRA